MPNAAKFSVKTVLLKQCFEQISGQLSFGNSIKYREVVVCDIVIRSLDCVRCHVIVKL